MRVSLTKRQMSGFVVLQGVFLIKPSLSAGFLPPPFLGDTPNALIMRSVFRSVIRDGSRFGSRFLPALVPTVPAVG